jgi:hypothetical protein
LNPFKVVKLKSCLILLRGILVLWCVSLIKIWTIFHEYLMQLSLKSGDTKDHFRQVKVPGTTSYWKTCLRYVYIMTRTSLVRYDLNLTLGRHRFYYLAPLLVLDPICLSYFDQYVKWYIHILNRSFGVWLFFSPLSTVSMFVYFLFSLAH